LPDTPSITIQVDPFRLWLELQLKLQQTVFTDPRTYSEDPEARATFVLWNAFAACDEIHEAMQEIGWKPWATSRHLNDAAFISEIVDALHFIGNMVLAAAEHLDETPEELAAKMWAAYQNKAAKNIQRQLEGYDGASDKCPICHRELQVVSTDSGIRELFCPDHGRIEI